MATDKARDITDHSLVIGCNSTVVKSGNHSISSNDCRLFPNKTTANQKDDCQPADLNGGDLGDTSPAASNNSSSLTTIGNQTDPFNSNGLQDDATLPLPHDQNNLTIVPHNKDNAYMITTFCGFVDQRYADGYLVWVPIDSFLSFFLPTLILVTANIATWIKVHRSSRESLTSTTAVTLRRTRHILILTSLISVTFIIFVTPMVVVMVIEAFLADDPEYVLFNGETHAVLLFISEYLYLCNHSFNFFLYILSGKRFKNSLKAALCNYEG